MATDESLLDVFVVVGIKETGENVDEYVERVKKVFGELANSGAKGPAAVKKSVENIRQEFDRLASTTKLTNVQIDRMAQLAVKLDGAALGAAQLRKNAAFAGSAVGGLTNNAYQLGQAFEDAAVGFSLNGIQGAVRGASNNITFLIQNLTAARIEQARLTGQTVSPLLTALPLYAAIGAAISLLVVGPLTDWVEALNDIELKTRGLATTIEREFSDATFRVSLELDNRSALKAVQDAENAKEAIRLVIGQTEAAEELRFKITAELDRVSQSKVFDDISKTLDQLQKAVDARLIDVNSGQVIFGGEFGPDTVLPGDPKEIQRVENLAAAINTVRIASNQAFEQAAKGLVPLGELESALHAVELLQKEAEELSKSGVLSTQEFEELKKILEALRAPLEAATEQAIKFEEAQAQLLDSTLKSLGLFTELSDQHKFLNEVNEGRLDKEDKILFDIRQQNIELEKQAEKAREAIGRNNPALEKGLVVAADVLQEEQRIELISEIKDLEKDIADRRADANKDAETAAKRRLEIEGKIGDEEIKGRERVASAEEALRREQQQKIDDDFQQWIQARIDALQKMDKTSTSSAVGTVGTLAFGDDVKPEVERLQELLKALRADEAKKANEDRIRDLEARIVSEREEAQDRLAGLRDDLQDARQEEIDAVNKNAEEIQKLIEQLRQFQEALLNNKLGLDPLADQAERDKLFFNEPDRMGFLPEDDIRGIGNAQANANAAAMEGVDFKSSSLETLTEQTNRLLFALNDGVSRLDLQTRLA